MARMASSAADVPWLLAVVESGQRMIEALTDELMSKAAKAESLTAEREWLERWKAEALGIIDNALAEVARLTAELAEVKRTYTPCDLDLLAERDALRSLLSEFVDDEPCWLDHHGYCQSHYYFDEDECYMARARAALADTETDTTDTQPTDQEDQ